MRKLFILLGLSSAVVAVTRVHCRTRDAQSNAFVYRMPSGIPGDVNRAWAATIEPNVYDANNVFSAYGVPVVLDANGVRPIQAGDAAAAIYGLLVRPFPTNQQTTTSFFGSSPLGTAAVPPAAGVADVLKRGYMTVQLNGVTASAPGGTVYVWVGAAGGGHVVGGIEAANGGANTIAMPANCYFRGAADASGNVEIAFNL